MDKTRNKKQKILTNTKFDKNVVQLELSPVASENTKMV